MGGYARILVVDDDESIRKVLKTVLEEEEYVVDTAENGKEAIKKSNVNFYNLALIDIKLADMEGTKLLTSMKPNTPKMVKIILTGYPSLENTIEAVNKGADAYILKPFNMDDVLSKIKEHLKKQQDTKRFNEEKVTAFIETRVRELEKESITPQKSR